MRSTDSGQSETLGFVLVFSIILASIALVAATGYGGLHQVQQAERTNNAVYAFEILADNVDDVVRGAPSRETELSLGGAGLYFGDPVTVKVRGERVTNPNENFSYQYELRPIVYDPGSGSTLVYANGAVIRVDRDGMVLLREPRLRLTDRETVIPVIQVRSSRGRAVGGQSSVVVETRRAEAVPLATTTKPYDVTIEVVSPRAEVWERHFSEHDAVTCTRSGDTVTCSLTTDRAYATLVRVDARFR